MSRGWEWKSGEWWISCDVCDKQIYASEAKHRWDGMIVCKEDFETRHPQELIKHRVDRQSVPFTRPGAADIFVDVPYIIYIEDGYIDDDYFEDFDE
jgi:hypothetical protein